MRPQRGQIIVLERMQPLLAQPLTTLRQTDEGTVMIGDSQEEVGFRETSGCACLRRSPIARSQRFPRFADAPRRSHVGRVARDES